MEGNNYIVGNVKCNENSATYAVEIFNFGFDPLFIVHLI